MRCVLLIGLYKQTPILFNDHNNYDHMHSGSMQCKPSCIAIYLYVCSAYSYSQQVVGALVEQRARKRRIMFWQHHRPIGDMLFS